MSAVRYRVAACTRDDHREHADAWGWIRARMAGEHV